MYRRLIRLALPLLVMLFATACLTVLSAAARDIDVGYDSRTLTPKQSEGQDNIRIETANPADMAPDPNDPNGDGTPGGEDTPGGKDTPGSDETGNGDGGTDNGKTNPGGTTPGSGGSPGANSGGQNNPGADGQPGADGSPDGEGQPGADGSPGADGNPEGNGNPEGDGSPGGQGDPNADPLNPDGDQGDGNSPSGNKLNPPKLDPGAGTDAGEIDPGKTDSDKTKEPDKPWYETLWDKATDFAKGSVAGAIGAGIVIGVVVIGAAIIGVTIGAPVLIAAAVVGIVAGGIYGIMSGENFSWTKGIGIGALGAIGTIAVAQSGVIGAIRGGIQLFRTSGFKGGMSSIGSRIVAYSRGTFTSVRNGLSALRGATIKETFMNAATAFGKTLISKSFNVTMFSNFGINLAVKVAFEGKLPTSTEYLQMGVESFVGALVIDKVANVLGSEAVSKFGKRMANSVVSFAEGLFVTPFIKGEKPNYGEAAQTSFIKSFIIQPIFRTRLNQVRLDRDIGTTVDEVRVTAPGFSDANVSQRQITNRSLDRMWQNGEINPNAVNNNTLNQWNNNGNQVTQRQFDRLLENQNNLDKVANQQQVVEKATEQTANKAVENQYGLKGGK
ncbi:collagen-like protein [Paenibacillus sp. FJAT-26967]|uniref:collagen-like protein n=1 Tax=Paenibacillus sp. FJAT-26967 TaxID=1729690 RepID=UPI000837B7C2|nr:collagen-like protein [Paenibacillus sp. FJAT-26967]